MTRSHNHRCRCGTPIDCDLVCCDSCDPTQTNHSNVPKAMTDYPALVIANEEDYEAALRELGELIAEGQGASPRYVQVLAAVEAYEDAELADVIEEYEAQDDGPPVIGVVLIGLLVVAVLAFVLSRVF